MWEVVAQLPTYNRDVPSNRGNYSARRNRSISTRTEIFGTAQRSPVATGTVAMAARFCDGHDPFLKSFTRAYVYSMPGALEQSSFFPLRVPTLISIARE